MRDGRTEGRGAGAVLREDLPAPVPGQVRTEGPQDPRADERSSPRGRPAARPPPERGGPGAVPEVPVRGPSS